MKVFPAIRMEGGLFAPDLFDQLLGEELAGQKPSDFGLPTRSRLTDEIASAFAEAENYWRSFKRRLDRLPEEDTATSLTRDSWVIPFLTLLDYKLTYVRKAYELGGMTFAISHRAGEAEDAPPVHIVGYWQELGRVAESGRPRLAPHSLIQEFLNRSEALWGLVTNGRVLRLLRDSTYIRRQCYVEFDLQAIFEQRLFEDFSILFRLLHRTRLPKSATDAKSCFLEQYYQHTIEQGGRVRDRLRDGVEEAIQILANGFLKHPHNEDLRHRVSGPASANDRISPEAFYQQLLRLVYRFLFLLVSEDRGLISEERLYLEHYSVSRFRRLVDRLSARTDHTDLWHSLRVLWKLLADDTSVQELDGKPLATLLGLPVLNGQLFEPLDLDDCVITNRDLLDALWHLINYQDSPASPPRRVNYAALDVEELGSVYESLLDFHPQIDTSTTPARFALMPGSERKSTGSYYTAHELVTELVRSALEPVLEERLAEARHVVEEVRRVEQGRMTNSEWRMGEVESLAIQMWRKLPDTVQKRFSYEYARRLSRSRGLETRHGDRQTGLHPDSEFSSARDIWLGEPNASGGSADSLEHREGVGSALYRGVHPVSEAIQRQSDGAGNSPHAEQPGAALPGSGDSLSPEESFSAGKTTGQFGEKSPAEKELALAWSRTPFAIRHSLFAEYAILSLRVLDPACGSGHFLLAAARYLGKRLARIRTGEDEPAPEHVREAIRDVVAHCIYGVDRNPLAVELCRVALWIESHTPGRPLTFLDHRIKCGDSLVGVFDMNILKKGIPNDAFAEVSGDDKKLAREIKRNNQNALRDLERGQLIFPFNQHGNISSLAEHARTLDSIPDDSPETIRKKKGLYNNLQQAMTEVRTACDLWTAAFFQKFDASKPRNTFITTDTLREWLERKTAHPQALAHARELAHRLRFFHWPLEFPEVFLASGEGRGEEGRVASREWRERTGGFDVVLCNPPWERIKLQEEEFFATRDPRISGAPNKAERGRRIRALRSDNPALWEQYQAALHDADALSKFLRNSGRFPLTARGDINTYSIFSELFVSLLAPKSRAGVVVPTGIATDATNQQFFAHVVASGRLVSLFDFENREKLFPAVDSRYKFSLLTLQGETGGTQQSEPVEEGAEPGGQQPPPYSLLASRPSPSHFAFFLTRAEHLHDPRRVFTLTPQDFALLNPNTRTCPIFRTRQDAELTKAIYRRVPVLVKEANGESRMANDEEAESGRSPFAAGHSSSNPWGVRFLAMFHMANDSHLFRPREELRRDNFRLIGNIFVKGNTCYLPLYEAKMIWHYDHRFGTYEGVTSRSSTHLPTPDETQHANPSFVAQPWYWVPAEEVHARLQNWPHGWLLGWRDITNATNERTVIADVIPVAGVGDKFLLMLPSRTPVETSAFLGDDQCLVHDYVARQKIGGVSLKYFTKKQIPNLAPARYRENDLLFIVPRVLELVYTAWDVKPFADDVWNDAEPALQEAIKRQWEENKSATGGVDPTPPDWLPLLDSLLATRQSPSAPTGIPFPPFKWDAARRAILQAELDAYYARLYGLTRKQLRYVLDPADLTERELEDILDPWEEVADPLDPQGYAERVAKSTFPGETFRVLKEKEIRDYGEYRTRRLVLEAWERLKP